MSDKHVHECACGNEDRCTYCGCCQHCDHSCRYLCKVTAAPAGMACPDSLCGCAGEL